MIDSFLGHRKRLKEKFKKNGINSFHDYEILELILTYSIPRRDVKPIAKALINHFKSFRNVLDAPLEELNKVKGIGENSAILIKLVKDVSTFYLHENIKNKQYINSLQDVLNYCEYNLSGQKDELFQLLYLNSKNEIIEVETIQRGTVEQSVIYPRKIVEQALKYNASALIFIHNHPSGDPSPSEADKILTQNLSKTLKTLDIIVYDHLIIGKKSYFSAREHGWIS